MFTNITFLFFVSARVIVAAMFVVYGLSHSIVQFTCNATTFSAFTDVRVINNNYCSAGFSRGLSDFSSLRFKDH